MVEFSIMQHFKTVLEFEGVRGDREKTYNDMYTIIQ